MNFKTEIEALDCIQKNFKEEEYRIEINYGSTARINSLDYASIIQDFGIGQIIIYRESPPTSVPNPFNQPVILGAEHGVTFDPRPNRRRL